MSFESRRRTFSKSISRFILFRTIVFLSLPDTEKRSLSIFRVVLSRLCPRVYFLCLGKRITAWLNSL
nr:hypothetical protein [uncultured bacterium]